MKKRLFFIALLFFVVTYPVLAEETVRNCYPITAKDLARQKSPKFDQYVTTAERIIKLKIDLKSHPNARTYRTVLREGVANGPNFAGHYAVVGWGCGTSCLQFAIVDVRSGKVIFPDDFNGVSGVKFETDDFEKTGVGPYWGLRYRIDSSLLVVVGMLNESENREGAFYYIIEKGKLKRIFTVIVKKDACDDRMND